MAEQRQYWVISPNVSRNLTYIDDWKGKIRKERVAILGWKPDEKRYKPGKRMGERFAGVGDPQ
ncbi:hypothetical protein DRH29_05950 [candidate division Kazan bacterium]|uniref:Uncharacterized protein n=1 Tax=candidate division Kazan bacterium TaxID=2202143 RepID=A0A420ZAS4_UNCK3|nr:MAG: hypothetical protein DRH29_05950 [candidate division Kazan bacterium]